MSVRTANTPARITRSWLENQGACNDEVQRFVAIFGDEVELTRANLQAAVEAHLNLGWLAQHYLPYSSYQQFQEAMQETDFVRAREYQAAQDRYQKALVGPRLAYCTALTEATRLRQEAKTAGTYTMEVKLTVEAARLAARTAYLEATAGPWRAAMEADAAIWQRYWIVAAGVLADLLELP